MFVTYSVKITDCISLHFADMYQGIKTGFRILLDIYEKWEMRFVHYMFAFLSVSGSTFRLYAMEAYIILSPIVI